MLNCTVMNIREDERRMAMNGFSWTCGPGLDVYIWKSISPDKEWRGTIHWAVFERVSFQTLYPILKDSSNGSRI